MTDSGRLTGSREPDPSSGSGPPGFDPGRKFTPGPWEWWDAGESLVRITEAAEQRLVARAALPSNARLIAAAPELYEQLAKASALLANVSLQDFRNCAKACDDLLAKARGEQVSA